MIIAHSPPSPPPRRCLPRGSPGHPTPTGTAFVSSPSSSRSLPRTPPPCPRPHWNYFTIELAKNDDGNEDDDEFLPLEIQDDDEDSDFLRSVSLSRHPSSALSTSTESRPLPPSLLLRQARNNPLEGTDYN